MDHMMACGLIEDDEDRAEREEQERKWESEEDVRALRRVAEMRKDKDRLKRARVMIAEQKAELERAGADL